MTYTYQDIPDKSKEGMDKELNSGLAKISFYFSSTYGFPFELFKEEFEEKCKNKADQWLFYLNFRNENPQLFK